MKQDKTLVWVIYDIGKNKIRNKISRLCKEAGLFRVQKSVFLGKINRNRLDEMVMQFKVIIEMKADSVYVFPMCQPDFNKTILLGQAFDEKLVNDEVRAFFI